MRPIGQMDGTISITSASEIAGKDIGLYFTYIYCKFFHVTKSLEVMKLHSKTRAQLSHEL